MSLSETVHHALKEHGPAAILATLTDECRQNAQFEQDNGDGVAAFEWRKVAHAIEAAWLSTSCNL